MGFGEPVVSYLPSDLFSTFFFGYGNQSGDDSISPGGFGFNGSVSPSASSFFNGGVFISLARAYDQTTLSRSVGLMSGFTNSTPYYCNPWAGGSPGYTSPISGGIDLTTADLTEYDGSFYYRRARFPILTCWNTPDFATLDGVVQTGLSNFPDILPVRGWTFASDGGLLFPVGDWDTVWT
jgi:hypothetical protein